MRNYLGILLSVLITVISGFVTKDFPTYEIWTHAIPAYSGIVLGKLLIPILISYFVPSKLNFGTKLFWGSLICNFLYLFAYYN